MCPKGVLHHWGLGSHVLPRLFGAAEVVLCFHCVFYQGVVVGPRQS